MAVRTKAAILRGINQPWSVEDVEIDPPRANEVMIKLASSGMCHSDEHFRTGDMQVTEPMLEAVGATEMPPPLIGGHEGAGEIVEVGPGVTNLAVGDHVVLGFLPSCGKCPSCAEGHQNLCDRGATSLMGWQIEDGTYRHRDAEGNPLGAVANIGTFCPYSIANVDSVIPIEPDIPLEVASLVGCGVTTGWGSAVYAADVQPGETVVVVGVGGVGMNTVQGAAMAGARHVIAVDPVEFKREQAQEFGATHTAASFEEAAELVGELTWGRLAEKTIITVDVVRGDMIAPAMGWTRKGGRVVVTGIAPMAAMDVQLNLADLTLFQKQLVGAIFGGCNPRYDIPRLLRLYQEGKLKLDELVTRRYPLADINDGYDDMYAGRNIRGMLTFDGLY